MSLHTETYGAGPPLVILHGLFGSGENWRTLARRFAERYHVHTVDLPGHGASPHLRPLTYPAMAEAVRTYLDDAGLTRAHLLGHSMGGKVAMELALTHPARVDRLVIVDIAPRPYPPGYADVLAAMRGLDLGAVRSRSAAGRMLAPAIPDAAIRQFLLKNLVLDGNDAYRWQIDLDGIQDQYRALSASPESLDLYAGPTCFIRGARSSYIRDADLETIRAYFPEAELVTIPDAGHWVHADAPDAFAEAVVAFLG